MKTPCLLRSSKDLLRANRREVLSSLLSCQKSGPVTSSFKPSSPPVSICYANLRKPTPAHSVGKCEFSHRLLQTLGVFNPNSPFSLPSYRMYPSTVLVFTLFLSLDFPQNPFSFSSTHRNRGALLASPSFATSSEPLLCH